MTDRLHKHWRRELSRLIREDATKRDKKFDLRILCQWAVGKLTNMDRRTPCKVYTKEEIAEFVANRSDLTRK